MSALDRRLSYLPLGLKDPFQALDPMTHAQLDLTVRGDSIERIYSSYRNHRYVVNRRYQRKLVWTIDEKRQFIDSISKGYPVPIILLADPKVAERDQLEIIDGMQRLNAVAAYIENEYGLDGQFFDLNAMAVTKALDDGGLIKQSEPILERETCVRIASYILPLSIFESASREQIEEVFRRINSGGRKLSAQELRAAGATGIFATIVRKAATLVRGDVSASDHVLLNDMKNISITSRELEYGIDVEDVFWVRNAVLTKDQVRESRDEEVIADVLAFMVSKDPPASRGEFFDTIFGFRDTPSAKDIYAEFERTVQKYGSDVLMAHFERVYDELRLTLSESGKSLGEVLFKEKPARAPRYFQIVFLALFDQLIKRNRRVMDRAKLIALLEGAGSSMKVPGGGSSWGANDRAREVRRTSSDIQDAFEDAVAADPARVRWISQLETVLTQSFTEQSAFDFKQGFLKLANVPVFDEENFERIVQNIVGIANLGSGRKGYLVVGVVDKQADASRIQQLFGVQASVFRSFRITGIDHEARALDKTLDEYFQYLVARIEASLSEPLRTATARDIKLVGYYDKHVLVIEITGQKDPSQVGGRYFIRRGNALREIEPADLVTFIKGYPAGRSPS